MREFIEEFAYLFALAFAIFLFIKGFMPAAKTVAARMPGPAGFKEAMAA